MLHDQHHRAYAALASVYLVLFLIFVKDGALPYAGCALATAMIYYLLTLVA